MRKLRPNSASSASIGTLVLPSHAPPLFSHPCLSDSSAEVMEVDHDKQLVYCETLCVSSLAALSPARLNGDASNGGATANLGLLGAAQPSDEQVAARLSAPVVTTQLDTRNIAFERSDTQISSALSLCKFFCGLEAGAPADRLPAGPDWMRPLHILTTNSNSRAPPVFSSSAELLSP